MIQQIKSFIESFQTDYPHDIKAIMEGFHMCFEADEESDTLQLSVPTNASPQDIQKMKTATTDTLNKAEKAAQIKTQATNELTKSVDALKKTNDEIIKKSEVPDA